MITIFLLDNYISAFVNYLFLSFLVINKGVKSIEIFTDNRVQTIFRLFDILSLFFQLFSMVISNKNGMCNLPQELPNSLTLKIVVN